MIFFKISYRLWNSFGGNYCDKCIKKSSCICKNIINVLRYLVTFVKCIEKSSLRWLVTYVTILFPKLFQYRTTFQIIKDLERALHSKRSKDKQTEYEWSTTSGRIHIFRCCKQSVFLIKNSCPDIKKVRFIKSNLPIWYNTTTKIDYFDSIVNSM